MPTARWNDREDGDALRREAALRARVAELEASALRGAQMLADNATTWKERAEQAEQRNAELEQIVIASLKAAPVGYIPTHPAERLPEIIADMTTACREHSEEREQAEARVAELEAALREVEGPAALRALREMAHDMDLPRRE